MSSKSQILKKLAELSNTLKGIQSTSAFFISLKDDAENVVKIWNKSFISLGVNPNRKLTYLYLVNDILQNEKKGGTHFMKAFKPVLPSIFYDIAKICDEPTKQSVTRLLKVWNERKVYPGDYVNKMMKIIEKVWTKDKPGSTAVSEAQAQPAVTSHSSKKRSHKEAPRHNDVRKQPRMHKSESASSLASSIDDANAPISPMDTPESGSTTPGQKNGATTLTPVIPRGLHQTLREELDLQLQKDSCEPPETADLLKALEELQNAASADAVVRKKISGFSPHVANVQAVQNIKSKSEGLRLLEEVEACDQVLVEYNERLDNEMAERKKIALMLRAYILHQPDKVKEVEARLDEYQTKLDNATKMRDQLNSHLSKLPDLSLLPDVTTGLDPLPSVGDLFS